VRPQVRKTNGGNFRDAFETVLPEEKQSRHQTEKGSQEDQSAHPDKRASRIALDSNLISAPFSVAAGCLKDGSNRHNSQSAIAVCEIFAILAHRS
jgi:hypothetical protein